MRDGIRFIFFFWVILTHLTLSAEEAVQVPDPLTLRSSWMLFFEGSGEDLSEKLELLNDRLSSLDKMGDPGVAELVVRLRQVSQAYQEAKARELSVPEALEPVQEVYTFEQIFALVQAVSSQENRLDAVLAAVRQAELVIQAGETQRKTLYDRYTKLEEPSAEKQKLGLQIMIRWFSQQVEMERLRLLRAQRAPLEDRILDLEGRVPTALKRVTIRGEDLPQLQRTVENQRSLVDSAQLAVLSSEALLSQVAGDSPEDKANLAIRRQQTLTSQFKYLEARLQLIYHLSELAFGLASNQQANAGREKLQEAQEVQSHIYSELRFAESSITQEFSTAQEALSVEEGEGTAPLRRLNQRRLSLVQDNMVAYQRLVAQSGDLDQLIDLVEEQVLAFQTGLWDTLTFSFSQLRVRLGQLADGVNRPLFRVADDSVTLGELMYFILVLVGAYFLSRVLRKGLRAMGRRDEDRASALYTLGRLLHYLILGLAVIFGLSSMGLDFSRLALFASALTVGLGFGLQSIINNFVSGIIVLFESSLSVGDYVELESGVRGTIKEINVRSTLICSNDGVDILVPNAQMVSERVINWTLRDAYRRLKIPFSVHYGVDKDRVAKLVLEAVSEVPYTIRHLKGREPDVRMTAFGADGLEFELVVWVNAFAARRDGKAVSAYLWEIERKLSDHQIDVPYPQRVIHVQAPVQKDLVGAEKS